MKAVQVIISSGRDVGRIYNVSPAHFPANTLRCDGSEVSRTTYPELFKVIGTSWGHGDGKSTFNLPDLRSGPVLDGSMVIPDPDAPWWEIPVYG